MILCPEYNLADHFITCNTYTCVELNAHSLIAARSMTSVFSTVINFGMLGLLQRLHCLQVQGILESEAEETKIRYSQTHKKEVFSYSADNNIDSITLEDISKTVEKACKEAKKINDEI